MARRPASPATRHDDTTKRRTRETNMIRAIFTLLVMGLLGMFVLGLLFSVLMPLLMLALKVAAVLVVGYLLLRLVSPRDADRLRDKLRNDTK
jgi:cell division septal protein FtsQ